MNILIIEDEKHNADRLVRLLKSIDGEAVVYGPLATVSEVVSFFSENRDVDLILSDIRLADGLCFDALDTAPASVPVIFTTAYDEYAITAFNFNGIAYILKPVDKDELSRAIEKSRRMSVHTGGSELSEIYRMLQKSSTPFRQRFLVVDKDGYMAVGVDKVRYISTDTGVVKIYLADNRRYTVEMSLDEIEQQLNPSNFFRATRQHIVNINAVQRISNWFNRKIKIKIKGYPDADIVVGKEKITRLKQWLDR